jgi:hypothetical protein
MFYFNSFLLILSQQPRKKQKHPLLNKGRSKNHKLLQNRKSKNHKLLLQLKKSKQTRNLQNQMKLKVRVMR